MYTHFHVNISMNLQNIDLKNWLRHMYLKLVDNTTLQTKPTFNCIVYGDCDVWCLTEYGTKTRLVKQFALLVIECKSLDSALALQRSYFLYRTVARDGLL